MTDSILPPATPASTRPLGDARPPRSKRAAPKGEVLILSRRRGLYSTRRLVEATRQQGRRARVVDTLGCTVVTGRGPAQLLVAGRPLRSVEVVIPRIGTSITGYGLAVVRQLELMGYPVLNGSEGIARSRDKLRALQLLAAGGLDVPRTAMAHPGVEPARLVESVGGLPVVIKLLRGTQGVGVMLASSLQEVRTLLGTFSGLGQEVVLQEFVAESAGRDLRVLVVGGRVVASMQRSSTAGDFRSNLHRGGQGGAVPISESFAAVAIRAARLMGLEVAGVDLLLGREGPRVLELNSSPGLEGIEATTGIDVAGAVLSHALSLPATARSAG